MDNPNGTVSSFEYPKQILKLMDKKTFLLLRWNCLLIWTYDSISREDSNQVAHLQHYYGLTRNHVWLWNSIILYYFFCSFSAHRGRQWWFRTTLMHAHYYTLIVIVVTFLILFLQRPLFTPCSKLPNILSNLHKNIGCTCLTWEQPQCKVWI